MNLDVEFLMLDDATIISFNIIENICYSQSLPNSYHQKSKIKNQQSTKYDTIRAIYFG